MQPYFGLKGRWLTFWLTVACSTEMTLFGYDQGVFSKNRQFNVEMGVTNGNVQVVS
jgi:hypothetical protein